MKKRNLVGLVFTASLLPLACSSKAVEMSGDPNEAEQTGVLQAALGDNGPTHDVVSLQYTVVHSNQTCSDPPVAIRSVPLALDGGSIPPSELPDGSPPGAGPAHPFGDAFFVLPPGQYLVCVQPFKAGGGHSNECALATTFATVMPGVTTEVLLVSQCTGPQNGGLNGVTILNSPPTINALNIIPSKFITACPGSQANLIVQASDPNGDALAAVWTVTDPNGNSFTRTGTLLIFNPRQVPGDFGVHVTVTDSFGASTSLTLTMHVVPCDPDAGAGGG
jgi:hypothetical protein